MFASFRKLALRHKAFVVVLAVLAGHGLFCICVLHWGLGLFDGGPAFSAWGVEFSAGAVYMIAFGAATLVAVLVAVRATSYITRPAADLTRVADAISIGNLDVRFDFGHPVRCWEIKRCSETSCKAYGNSDVQCWYIDGTPCRGVEPRFPQKLLQCRNCDVYHAHRGDEIVQLADAFQHMARSLKVSQEERLRMEHLAATGETVAMISHSIRNLHDSLMGGVHIFKRGVRLGDESMRSRGWEMVERNLGGVSELVRNLIEFSKAREPFLEACDLASLLTEVADVHRGRAEAAGVTIESRVEDGIGVVYLDVHSTFHALVNLVGNSMDAMAPGRAGIVRLSAALEGERLVMAVEDNGAGIAPDVLSRLFKGMFSTKGSKGTGLGLLSVQKSIGEQGGTVEVSSEEGKGTVFRIVLPFRDTVR